MSNSLVKFTHQQDGGERGQLYWGRADIDGLPFRGRNAPLLRKEEFEERVVRVADPKNGTFFTGDAEENAAYMRVMDGVANGWYHLLFIERWREGDDRNHYVYVEWVQYYLEDGSPTQYDPLGQSGM